MAHLDHRLPARAPRVWRAETDSAAEPRLVDSGALLQGARKLTIAHAGEVYTLHLTRQNKLLLTK